MKILHASVSNFGSYKSLEFDFTNQGLTLISGATGAGKSTLCDVIPWILFGITSKGGSVDEVRNWTAEEPTTGSIMLDLNGKMFQVIRSRKPNDLAIWEDGGVYRGKDLNDTQKIINSKLGISAELYLSGAYFHEFSQPSQFFTLTAKQRRQITEQLVDLSLPKILTEKVSIYKKLAKDYLEEVEKDLLLHEDRYKRRVQDEINTTKQIEAWHERQAAKIAQAKGNFENFENQKTVAISRISVSISYETEQYNKVTTSIKEAKGLRGELYEKAEYLADKITQCDKVTCEHCGAPKQNKERQYLVREKQRFDTELASVIADLKHYENDIKRLEASIKLLNDSLIKERLKANTWSEEYFKLIQEQHPYASGDQNETKELAKRIEGLVEAHDDTQVEISDLELLSEITNDLRGLLIKNTVSNLETQTNKLLNDFFDAEIRITLSVAEADKLDVQIYKDGNEASFTQLSKGQRQLLKLCFGISVMQSVQNTHGVSFNCVFLDEVFSGLDETLKAKGFQLLQGLAQTHDSVFVIDHSEDLKARFSNKYEVSLVNGESQISNG